MSDLDLIGDEQMYRENILEHSRTPRNKGRIADATMAHRELNHSCGDEIELYLKIDGDKLTDVKFEGHGCAISQASVSLLTEKIKGMSIDQLRALTKEDVFTLLGIEVGMTRLRCALLGLKTLEVGLNEYLKDSTETI